MSGGASNKGPGEPGGPGGCQSVRSEPVAAPPSFTSEDVEWFDEVWRIIDEEWGIDDESTPFIKRFRSLRERISISVLATAELREEKEAL